MSLDFRGVLVNRVGDDTRHDSPNEADAHDDDDFPLPNTPPVRGRE
jgi:hypothetical protein